MIETLNTDKKVAYPLDEASRLVGVSKSLLRKEISAGRLRAKLIRRRVVVLHDDLTDYISREAKDWTPQSERLAAAV